MKRNAFIFFIIMLFAQNIFCALPKELISENNFTVYIAKAQKTKEGYLIKGSVSAPGFSSPVKIDSPFLLDKFNKIYIDNPDIEFDITIENIKAHAKGLTIDKSSPNLYTLHTVYFTSSYGKILFKDMRIISNRHVNTQSASSAYKEVSADKTFLEVQNNQIPDYKILEAKLESLDSNSYSSKKAITLVISEKNKKFLNTTLDSTPAKIIKLSDKGEEVKPFEPKYNYLCPKIKIGKVEFIFKHLSSIKTDSNGKKIFTFFGDIKLPIGIGLYLSDIDFTVYEDGSCKAKPRKPTLQKFNEHSLTEVTMNFNQNDFHFSCNMHININHFSEDYVWFKINDLNMDYDANLLSESYSLSKKQWPLNKMHDALYSPQQAQINFKNDDFIVTFDKIQYRYQINKSNGEYKLFNYANLPDYNIKGLKYKILAGEYDFSNITPLEPCESYTAGIKFNYTGVKINEDYSINFYGSGKVFGEQWPSSIIGKNVVIEKYLDNGNCLYEPDFTAEIDGTDKDLKVGDIISRDDCSAHIISIKNNKTIVKFTRRIYNVTFDSNNIVTVFTPEQLTGFHLRQTISVPKSPVAKGYKFVGWYKDKECKELWNFSNNKITGDTTLYAKWKACSNENGFWIFTDKDEYENFIWLDYTKKRGALVKQLDDGPVWFTYELKNGKGKIKTQDNQSLDFIFDGAKILFNGYECTRSQIINTYSYRHHSTLPEKSKFETSYGLMVVKSDYSAELYSKTDSISFVPLKVFQTAIDQFYLLDEDGMIICTASPQKIERPVYEE